MLAGCQLSVSWARGVLYELVEQLSKVNPEYPCWAHVDDLSHVIVEETPSELRANLLKAGRVVGGGSSKAQLKDFG